MRAEKIGGKKREFGREASGSRSIKGEPVDIGLDVSFRPLVISLLQFSQRGN